MVRRQLLSVRMSSALGYYAAKNRASDRLETKRNEISRSSAYIIDSSTSRSNYSTSSSYTSNYSDTSRAGRTRFRDSSTDYSAKLRKLFVWALIDLISRQNNENKFLKLNNLWDTWSVQTGENAMFAAESSFEMLSWNIYLLLCKPEDFMALNVFFNVKNFDTKVKVIKPSYMSRQNFLNLLFVWTFLK